MGYNIISLLIILANLAVSYTGFNNRAFFERYIFEVDGILKRKEYFRLITSGFLHVSWTHLLLNMFSLYVFSDSIESLAGGFNYLLIYMASLLCGNLFALLVHRHHGDYSAVGASGAVSGVIFASIALYPGVGVGLFGVPMYIPGWLYGLLYVLYSIYGIRSGRDNIGHEAHLGGAFSGMVITLMLFPAALAENYMPVIAIATPCILFMYLIITKPSLLLVDNYYFKTHKRYHSVDDRYNTEKADKQKEVDRILEKIHRKGVKSLTKQEKETLDRF